MISLVSGRAIALLAGTLVAGAAASPVAASEDASPDNLSASEVCSTERTTLSAVEREPLLEGVVYSTVYAIGKDCSIAVQSTEALAIPGEVVQLPDSRGMQALASTQRVIHGSQTIQDIVNLDISRFRLARERAALSGQTKFTSTRYYHAWDGNLAWNHVSGVYIGPYTSSYTAFTASAYGNGRFHSDFLWCNLQPGQDFTMYTTLYSYGSGSYNVAFSQSRTCTGTHMATAKKMDTIYAAW